MATKDKNAKKTMAKKPAQKTLKEKRQAKRDKRCEGRRSRAVPRWPRPTTSTRRGVVTPLRCPLVLEAAEAHGQDVAAGMGAFVQQRHVSSLRVTGAAGSARSHVLHHTRRKGHRRMLR